MTHDHTRRLILAMQAGILTPAEQRDAADLLSAYVARAEAIERDRDRIVEAAQEDAALAENVVVRFPPRGWPKPFATPGGVVG
jgi:hypothetical protein